MQQSAKFIDLRRTYLPINANTFPTSMHGTTQEDSPETRIPVMAYEAKNILPTAQGYKSYFGTDQVLDVDEFEERADHVFVFQNLAFANVLIALTETGVWIKKANIVGAWTQAIAMPAPLDAAVHYEWTYVVISNILYVYRQNFESYQKIVSDVTSGVIVTSVVPNTLNMAGQMGIFRAGGRLGFWDSDDSIAWSSQDDYADFAPSILTFAGSSKFLDVNGRIVTIIGHGPGFMIYCTKSVLYIQANTEATFQWSPKPIFSTNGITYRNQCVAGSPDTTHFAYTSEGLYKIENAKEEVLVAEVTDALATHAGPIYLSMSEGRYLYLQILDPLYLDSLSQFTQGTTGESQYYFPGSNVNLADAIDEEILNGTNICGTIAGMNDGIYAAAPAVPGDAKDGTSYRAIWTAYLSNKGILNGDVSAWTNVPVATIDPNGAEANQCPAGYGTLGHTSELSTGALNKTEVAGTDAYIDGIWTMERFVQAQEAIWELQEQELQKFFNKVLARQKTVVKETDSATTPGSSNTTNKQEIGTYASTFTKGSFGFSKCEFWLTRWCVGAKKISRVKKNIVNVEDTQVTLPPVGYTNDVFIGGGNASYTLYSTPQAACAGYGGDLTYIDTGLAAYGTDVYSLTGIDGLKAAFKQCAQQGISGGGTAAAWAVYRSPVGYTPSVSGPAFSNISLHVATHVADVGRYHITETMIALNSDEDIAFGPQPDTGFCTLTGWEYTKTDNTKAITSTGGCSEPASYPKDSDVREAPPGGMGIGGDGSFCSIPFEPVTIDPEPGVVSEWPGTYVTLPAGSFLLQDGSIAPIYPDFHGALVYDLRLKKWGVYNGVYKLLLNYSPINNSDSGVIPYSIFGILGGILAKDGFIKLFTDSPSESYITYGKVGFYRLGMTSCEEVHVNFDRPSTGYLRVDTSVDGRFVDPGLAVGTSFTAASKVRHTGANPGSWNNITISGNFQISYLEYRARTNGKR